MLYLASFKGRHLLGGRPLPGQLTPDPDESQAPPIDSPSYPVYRCPPWPPTRLTWGKGAGEDEKVLGLGPKGPRDPQFNSWTSGYLNHLTSWPMSLPKWQWIL